MRPIPSWPWQRWRKNARDGLIRNMTVVRTARALLRPPPLRFMVADKELIVMLSVLEVVVV
jgi:hypothetical protein